MYILLLPSYMHHILHDWCLPYIFLQLHQPTTVLPQHFSFFRIRTRRSIHFAPFDNEVYSSSCLCFWFSVYHGRCRWAVIARSSLRHTLVICCRRPFPRLLSAVSLIDAYLIACFHSSSFRYPILYSWTRLSWMRLSSLWWILSHGCWSSRRMEEN